MFELSISSSSSYLRYLKLTTPRVPLLLGGMLDILKAQLELSMMRSETRLLRKWTELADRSDRTMDKVDGLKLN